MIAAVVLAAVLALAHRARPQPLRRSARPPHRWPKRRDTSPPPEAWAAWLDTLAAHVRGGASLAIALDATHEHHRLCGTCVRPGTAAAALVQARPADPHEAVVVQVLAVAAVLGGSVAATLQAGAALLRERAAVAAEARAHAAQARLSARVLTAVPLAFASWNLLASTSFRRAVLTPTGGLAVCLGATLSAVGWWWMHRLVERVSR